MAETQREPVGSASARAERVAQLIASSLEPIGADAGFLATMIEQGRTLEVLRVTRYSSRPIRLAFSVDAPYPLAEAVRTRETLFIASNEQMICDHPGMMRLETEDHACATVPLIAETGELLGAVNLGFEDPHEFTAEERRLIEALGEECARALAPP
jgi:GAF domain-containing protein